MNIWDQLVDCICRPPRDSYDPRELLGGAAQSFFVGGMECTRLDFELTNKAGLKLVCSHYLPLDASGRDGKLPVVIYCHCNSGSRRDAEEALYHLLPCGVGVVAFDFTGSGLSDGKWVTLGANEVDDLAVVVAHLRAQGGVAAIGLWGRSMGAVTALLYSHRDPDIAGMVLDSPFSRLTDLMLDIVVSQRLPIPKVMLRLALRLMRASVRRKAGADINAVSPLDVVGGTAIPAMFGHGEDDTFIDLQHSVKLYEAYNAAAPARVYKNLVRFPGDHNHPRPPFFYSSVCCFFHQQLALEQVLVGGNPADAQQLLRHGSLGLAAAGSGALDRANGFIITPPWDLQPMTSLTPEEHAAAAAAAAALLAAEAERGGDPSGHSSGAGASRHGGDAAGAAGASGGSGRGPRGEGLNSPRSQSPAAAVRPLLSDAGAGSSGASGGGRAAAAPGSGGSNALSVPQQQQRQRCVLPASPAVAAAAAAASSSGGGARRGSAGIQCKRLPATDEGFVIGSRGAAGGDASSLAAMTTAAAAGEGPARHSSGSSSAGGGSTGQQACQAGSVSPARQHVAAADVGGGSGSPAAAAGAMRNPHFKWPWKRGLQAPGAAGSSGGGDAAAAAQQQHAQQQQQQQQAWPPAPGAAHDDGDLEAAIAASLADQHAAPTQPGQQQPAPAAGRAAPVSREEEEAMLQQAIQLSLSFSAGEQPAGAASAGAPQQLL